MEGYHGIKTGYATKDKLLIAINLLLHIISYPIVRFFFTNFGIHVFSPSKIIREYKCFNEYGVFFCPGERADLEFIKEYEPSVRSIIKDLKSGIFVDVGANIGRYTIMASKMLGNRGKVVAVEANPKYFRYLQKNAEVNECKNVEMHNVAAWWKIDVLKLYEHKFGMSHLDGSVVEKVSDIYHEVKAIPLDDILKNMTIDLLKVDVEGAEPYVFRGLHHSLSSNLSMKIIFEALGEEALAESRRLLESYGYGIVKLADGNYYATRNAQ